MASYWATDNIHVPESGRLHILWIAITQAQTFRLVSVCKTSIQSASLSVFLFCAAVVLLHQRNPLDHHRFAVQLPLFIPARTMDAKAFVNMLQEQKKATLAAKVRKGQKATNKASRQRPQAAFQPQVSMRLLIFD